MLNCNLQNVIPSNLDTLFSGSDKWWFFLWMLHGRGQPLVKYRWNHLQHERKHLLLCVSKTEFSLYCNSVVSYTNNIKINRELLTILHFCCSRGIKIHIKIDFFLPICTMVPNGSAQLLWRILCPKCEGATCHLLLGPIHLLQDMLQEMDISS